MLGTSFSSNSSSETLRSRMSAGFGSSSMSLSRSLSTPRSQRRFRDIGHQSLNEEMCTSKDQPGRAAFKRSSMSERKDVFSPGRTVPMLGEFSKAQKVKEPSVAKAMIWSTARRNTLDCASCLPKRRLGPCLSQGVQGGPPTTPSASPASEANKRSPSAPIFVSR